MNKLEALHELALSVDPEASKPWWEAKGDTKKMRNILTFTGLSLITGAPKEEVEEVRRLIYNLR